MKFLKKLKKKYIDIKDNLFGINEFFQMFDIDLVVSKKEYYKRMWFSKKNHYFKK